MEQTSKHFQTKSDLKARSSENWQKHLISNKMQLLLLIKKFPKTYHVQNFLFVALKLFIIKFGTM